MRYLRNLCLERQAMLAKAPMTETTLNLRGLKCPLPALRTRKALGKLAAGDVLVVECTDPLAGIDIPNLIRETGDEVENTTRQDDVIVFQIRKRAK
jgi:tRNA 2-thiouridine synthesizing protein A